MPLVTNHKVRRAPTIPRFYDEKRRVLLFSPPCRKNPATIVRVPRRASADRCLDVLHHWETRVGVELVRYATMRRDNAPVR